MRNLALKNARSARDVPDGLELLSVLGMPRTVLRDLGLGRELAERGWTTSTAATCSSAIVPEVLGGAYCLEWSAESYRVTMRLDRSVVGGFESFEMVVLPRARTFPQTLTYLVECTSSNHPKPVVFAHSLTERVARSRRGVSFVQSARLPCREGSLSPARGRPASHPTPWR